MNVLIYTILALPLILLGFVIQIWIISEGVAKGMMKYDKINKKEK